MTKLWLLTVLDPLPYLTCWVDACTAVRQTPSAEVTARTQCATPSDLKVGRAS